ncbi:alpha/beta fold hydrolase [Catellatospora tritici]|uniref:alpha/beta fold hydrolase n=1 Tax=Catellatospora tritici TaxID=2851566 RepID=UPI001C2D2C27|nr:alpha/beta hydrolase [Catellatospora tritici]MBV1853312.1 alpha/beta hydrolase [Catellatospora tritici]
MTDARVIDLHSPDGTRLALHDFGGTGDAVLLLPGLCGYAGEWSATAEWLVATHHVYALDPRGHGASQTRPGDVSREAHVADTVAALTRIGPVVLVGQSLGGHTAMLTAATRPDLVARLVLVEAGPKGGDGTADTIDRWLASWPVPFPDLATAAEFLGGGLVGPAWAGGLRQHPDGWRPVFERDVMVATVAGAHAPRWAEFARIDCDILLVRGSAGFMDADEFTRMAEHPKVTAVEVEGAGHDVHLDSPQQWRDALTAFLGR